MLCLVCGETWMCFCERSAMSYFVFRTVCGIAKPERLELLPSYVAETTMRMGRHIEHHPMTKQNLTRHCLRQLTFNALNISEPMATQGPSTNIAMTEHAGSLAQSLTFLTHSLAHEKAI